MKKSELRALIDLLDDHQVYEQVRSKLLEYGSAALPYLTRVIRDEDPERIERANAILDEIHQETFENEWRQLLLNHAGTDLPLEDSIWFIARIKYPAVDVHYYTEQLDDLAEEISQRLQKRDSGITIARRLIGVLVNDHNFNGNAEEYYDEDNSYLNKVIDNKMGIPISLSVLYMLIGRRIGIDLKGIGVPAHFMLKFTEESDSSIYYIDPFHRGRILDRAAVQRFCMRLGVGFSEDYLTPVSNSEIVERMLRNLVMVYTKQDNDEMLEKLQTMLNIYVDTYLERTHS